MSDFASLLFYILSFSISAVIYKQYVKTNKRIFIVVSFIIPMLIGGLRYNVGTDYMNYLNAYQNNENIDIGFSIFSRIARIFDDFKVLFFMYNFFTLLFLFIGLENVKNENRSKAYFIFLFLYYTTSFNAMRQMLAVSIIFCAYKYVYKNNFLKYSVMVLLASIFHTTAIFLLVLYPILKSTKKWQQIIFILTLIVIILNYQYLLSLLTKIPIFSHFEIYNEKVVAEFSNKSLYLELLFCIFIYLHKSKIINYDKINSVYLYIYTMGVLFSFIGFINPYVKRFAIYLLMPNISLLSAIPELYIKRENKFINTVLVSFLPLLKFVILIYILKQSKIIPYQW